MMDARLINVISLYVYFFFSSVATQESGSASNDSINQFNRPPTNKSVSEGILHEIKQKLNPEDQVKIDTVIADMQKLRKDETNLQTWLRTRRLLLKAENLCRPMLSHCYFPGWDARTGRWVNRYWNAMSGSEKWGLIFDHINDLVKRNPETFSYVYDFKVALEKQGHYNEGAASLIGGLKSELNENIHVYEDEGAINAEPFTSTFKSVIEIIENHL